MTHCIVHVVPSLARSGLAHQFALLAAGLPRDEFAVHVIALDDVGPVASDLQQCGIEPLVIGRRWPVDPHAFWRLRAQIRRLRPDLVHTWQFSANSYGRAAALLTDVRKLVASERHIDTWKQGHEWAMDRWLAKRTERIVVNSVAVRDFYVSRGFDANAFALIPSAVSPMESSHISRAELLMDLGLPSDARLIAYCGALTWQKRVKELIWAADQLKAVGTSAHLLIVGVGPQQEALKRFARLNRVVDRVHFLGQLNDLGRLLAHVDVLWQAGAYEGHSSAILQSMAAGIPVVAADAAGNRELVTNGETGYLVPLRERAGFARWTLPLLENADLAQRFGTTARQQALERHRVEGLIAKHVELYRELLD